LGTDYGSFAQNAVPNTLGTYILSPQSTSKSLYHLPYFIGNNLDHVLALQCQRKNGDVHSMHEHPDNPEKLPGSAKHQKQPQTRRRGAFNIHGKRPEFGN
jgi:hypothetical protein